MKYSYTVLSLLFLLPLLIKAQSNYKPGYVVTLKGDTIKGFIDLRDWNTNPAAIDFKSAISEKQFKSLTTSDIQLFSIENTAAYQKYTGRISMDAADIEHANDSKDTSFKVASVFLKILQKGNKLILFEYKDEVKPRYFVRDASDTTARELGYRIYKVEDQSGNTTKTVIEKTYIRQLSVLAEKYGVLNEDMSIAIQRANYLEDDILKIISRINGISKEEFKKEYSEKTKVHLVISGGLGIAQMNPYGNYAAIGGKSSTSFSPQISFGTRFSLNRYREDLMLGLDGIISGNHYQSIYIYTGSPYVPVRYSYSQVWFAIVPQVIYNFYNTADFKIFAGFGVALTLHQYYNQKFDIDYAASKGTVTSAPLLGDAFFNKVDYPLFFKVGARVSKKWEVFANYFTPSEVSKDHYFQIKSSDIQLGLSYFLR